MSEPVLFHGPCQACGSTDARAAYADGSAHCFSCSDHAPPGSSSAAPRPPRTAPRELLEVDTNVSIQARALAPATCRLWRYGFAQLRGRTVQVAQFCDANGDVVAQKVRHPDKTFEWLGRRDRACPLYGQWLWPTKGRLVVITEGELDALSMSQVQGNRWPVVSVPDGAGSAARALRQAADWLAGYDTVVLMFDQDEAGRTGAAAAARTLRPGQAKVAQLPLKDPNEMLVAGRGDELVRAMWNAVPYRPDGVVAGVDLLEHMVRPVPPATPYPFPELQAVTGGLRQGEITMFTGGSGLGKSTLVRTVALSLADTGRVGYVALEESVQRTVLDLVGMRAGRNLRADVYGRGDLSSTAAASAEAAWVADRFVLYDHFGSIQADRIADVVRHMVLAEGCQHVVLDHISIVVSGGVDEDERRAIDRVMTQARQMVEETRVGLLVVSHLRRRGGEARSYEQGAVPRLSELRGSGSLEQLSDTVVALSRDVTDADPLVRARATLHVLKNRAMGEVGPAGEIGYDRDTGRMFPLSAAPFKEDF